MSKLSEKLAQLTQWQKEYPCNSCKTKWGCDDCEKLRKWLEEQK